MEEEAKEQKAEIPAEAQKEETREVKEEATPQEGGKIKPNLLEFGEYRMFGPDNGDISIDRIELKSVTGANRIWKIKSLDRKQIIFEVVKFG